MGEKRKIKSQGAPGCSSNPPAPTAAGKEAVQQESPDKVNKRRKQQISTRKTFATGLGIRSSCSSSMSVVNGVFGSFNSEKMLLVEETGFGGMLRLPAATEADPQNSLWLMRSVETSDRDGLYLHTRNVHGMLCRDVDVHFVLGVPFRGAEIALGGAVSVGTMRVLRKLLLLPLCSFPVSLLELREVLLKDYDGGMSYEQRASFKIAAVLFAVTIFLAPSCFRPEYANTEVIKHILDPDKIKDVNWARYFIRCIKRDAARLKDEIAAGASAIFIHACPSILQVA
jgi:hypothetical protein